MLFLLELLLLLEQLEILIEEHGELQEMLVEKELSE